MTWERPVLSGRGFKRVGRHLRVLRIHGVKVHRKRPRGVQANPLTPYRFLPEPDLSRCADVFGSNTHHLTCPLTIILY